jgi:hypothetical protein
MLDRESQNDSAIVQWSTDGNSFIIVDQNQFEAVSILDFIVCIATIAQDIPTINFRIRTGHNSNIFRKANFLRQLSNQALSVGI